jgi:hypothetical protein
MKKLGENKITKKILIFFLYRFQWKKKRRKIVEVFNEKIKWCNRFLERV